MSTGKNVFLIGPGFIGREVLDRLLAEGYNITTLTRRKESAKDFEDVGVEALIGSLEDSEIISDQVSKSDVVIHTATADDVGSVKAVVEGIRRTSNPIIYIHNSGAGVLDDGSKGMYKSDKIYKDDHPADLDAVPDSAPHREVDLVILNARKSLAHAKMAIVLPPIIYGYNPKYGRTSIQLPTLTRYAVKHGYAGYVGKGLAVWSQIHVFDVATAYLTLLHWLERPETKVIDNPYFFVENGTESSWEEIAQIIAKALHEQGRLNSSDVKSIPEDNYGDLFGPGATETVVGSNSRSRANRLRELGWQPKEKSMYESLLEDELPVILKEDGEFKGYGRRAA